MNFLSNMMTILNFSTAIIALIAALISLIGEMRRTDRVAYEKNKKIFFKILRLTDLFLWLVGSIILIAFKNFDISIWFFIAAELLFIYNFIRDKNPVSRINIVVLVSWTSGVCLLICLNLIARIGGVIEAIINKI